MVVNVANPVIEVLDFGIEVSKAIVRHVRTFPYSVFVVTPVDVGVREVVSVVLDHAHTLRDRVAEVNVFDDRADVRMMSCSDYLVIVELFVVLALEELVADEELACYELADVRDRRRVGELH